MRIGIDARIFSSADRGIGRYTQALITHLEYIASKQDDFFIFLRPAGFRIYQPKHSSFHAICTPWKPYSFQEQLFLPQMLQKFSLDLMHFPHWNAPILYRRPCIVTIHDLLLDSYPEFRKEATRRSAVMYAIKFLGYRINTASLLKRSAAIVAVSGGTKQEILLHYRVLAERIHVIPNGIQAPSAAQQIAKHISSQHDERVLFRYTISKPFVLTVGAAYPHKNLRRAIRAFLALPNVLAQQFVIIGKKDSFFDALERETTLLPEGFRVKFPGYVSEHDLAQILSQAQAFFFPSLAEGFGLPPLEAMQYGVPVLASNAPCLPEVLGDAPLYCDPESVDDMSEKLRQILSDTNLRQQCIEKGRSQVKHYSWRKTAAAIYELYHRCFHYSP